MMNKSVSSQILNTLDDIMKEIVSGKILVKLYTPIWFLGTNKKYFKIQMDWYEDAPSIKAYLNDLLKVVN